MTASGPVTSRWVRDRAIEAAVFAALAVLSTWPLVLRMDHALPLGPYQSGTVTLASEWTLWWNADRLGAFYAGYWDAPIFAPMRNAFALSEPEPLAGALFALFFSVTRSLERAYGLVLLALLVANGWAGAALLRKLGTSYPASVAGGSMLVLLPFVHSELGVMPFVPVCGMVAALSAFLELRRGPSARAGAFFGATVGASYLLCAQTTLLFAVVLAITFLLLLRRENATRPMAVAVLAAIAVAGVVIAPVALRQLDATRALGLQRSLDTVREYSAGVNRYVQAPYQELLPFPFVPHGDGVRHRFFPGTLKVLLAGFAVASAVRGRSRTPDLFVVGGVLAVVAVLVGTGPLLDLGALSPFRLLGAVVPGYHQIRGFYRIGVVVQIVVVLLAATSLDDLAGELRARWSLAHVKPGLAAVALLAVVEMWPRGQRFFEPYPITTHAAWTAFVRTRTPSDAVLAFVPFVRGKEARDFEQTAQWMRLGAFFQRRMVNGYSSYFPRSHSALVSGMKTFPSEAAVEALRKAGVTHVVVFRESSAATPDPAPLERLFADDHAHVDVYRLTPGP